MSEEKFGDLTIEDLQSSIALFELTQNKINDKILQNQIDELKKELDRRLKPLNEKVLIKG